MKVYNRYCANYDKAIENLYQFQEDHPAFVKFLQEASADPRLSISLQSCLIMPVQRVPRYPMLLEAVLRYTPEDHPDYSNLVQALETVRSVANAVNDSMDDMDDRLRVMQIQNNFLTSHVSQYGLGFVPLKVRTNAAMIVAEIACC
mgnify:FL=1